jgi:hypothetical protein
MGDEIKHGDKTVAKQSILEKGGIPTIQVTVTPPPVKPPKANK